MAEPVSGWIWGHNLRGFLGLLSHYVGYAFDETDWETIGLGVGETDDEKPDRWYSYPLIGTEASVEVRLARAVGGDEVCVIVVGVESLELRLRADTLVDACAALPGARELG
ncbi:hypothetical protein ACFV0C_09195 [Streptomyces sp. NPDC059568]|uniref:hypothetical protein n=1 Tax=unclassified Streptomyces TaxID=2593676 RepID=UPI00364AD8BC